MQVQGISTKESSPWSGLSPPTCSEENASWSLNWPSGANLLARKQRMYFFGASVTTVRLFFFVIGRLLTRLD